MFLSPFWLFSSAWFVFRPAPLPKLMGTRLLKSPCVSYFFCIGAYADLQRLDYSMEKPSV
jgi:hypothetical protein